MFEIEVNDREVTANPGETIYTALKNAGIEIPYSKLDLYVKEQPGVNQ